MKVRSIILIVASVVLLLICYAIYVWRAGVGEFKSVSLGAIQVSRLEHYTLFTDKNVRFYNWNTGGLGVHSYCNIHVDAADKQVVRRQFGYLLFGYALAQYEETPRGKTVQWNYPWD
jgi:hypothetical protein